MKVAVLALLVVTALLSSYQVFGEYGIDDLCGNPIINSSIGSQNSNLKIVNCQPAVPHSFPWVVSLRFMEVVPVTKKSFPQVKTTTSTPEKVLSGHRCAGSLIGRQYVLTSASCLPKGISANDIQVIVGLHNLNDTLPANIDNVYDVVNIAKHENYSATYDNDLAILQLYRPLSDMVYYTVEVFTICLPATPQSGTDINGKSGVVVGWGTSTGSPAVVSSYLQQAMVNVKNSTCSKTDYFQQERMFCVLGETANIKVPSKICSGDAGGPLMKYVNGKWRIYGVASLWAANQRKTFMSPKPSMYTSIPYHLGWIKRIIKKLEDIDYGIYDENNADSY